MLVHLCAERHPHRHAPPSSQSASSPSLPVVARCSLDGCRLMDESPLSSSVKAPLYQAATAWAPHIWLDPSGSQFPPVIAHTAKAGDATGAAIGAQRLTRWGRHFGARRGYGVKLGLAWPVLHLAGEECDKGILGERVSFLFITADIPYGKPHSRFCHSNLTYMRVWVRTVRSLQSVSLTLALSSILYSSSSFSVSISVTLAPFIFSLIYISVVQLLFLSPAVVGETRWRGNQWAVETFCQFLCWGCCYVLFAHSLQLHSAVQKRWNNFVLFFA